MLNTASLLRAVTVAGILAAFPLQSSGADDTEAFYRGKTIRIIVPVGPAGAFDKYCRLLARHYSKYILGNPNIIMQYMPGGGTNAANAANYMARVAPQDGTDMSMPLAPIALAQAMGSSTIQYDATKFNWIGRMVDINRVIADWRHSRRRGGDLRNRGCTVAV